MNWAIAAGILTTFITSAASVAIAWVNRGKLAEVHGQNSAQLDQGTAQQKAIAEVHILVNAQLTAVVERVAQLTETLDAAGVSVPEAPADGG